MEVKKIEYDYTRRLPLGAGIREINVDSYIHDFCHLEAIFEDARLTFEKEREKIVNASREKIARVYDNVKEKIESIIRDYIEAQEVAYIMLFEEKSDLGFVVQDDNEREITWSIANKHRLDMDDESNWGHLSLNVVYNKKNAVLHFEVWSEHLMLSVNEMRDLYLSKEIPLVDMYNTDKSFPGFQIVLGDIGALEEVFKVLREEIGSDEYAERF